jgi:hypothetical protein
MFELVADPEVTRRFVQARWRAVGVSSGLAVPLFFVLMVVEYRAFILYCLLLVYPLMALVGMVRVKRLVGSGGAIGITLADEGARITIVRGGSARASAYRDPSPGGVGTVVIPYTEMPDARIGLDAVHLVRARPVAPGRVPAFELYVIPCPRADLDRLGHALASRGVRVHVERGARIATQLVTLLFRLTARFVAPLLVLGAIANFVLAATHRGGSLLLGAALIGAAFTLLLTTAILRKVFEPRS